MRVMLHEDEAGWESNSQRNRTDFWDFIFLVAIEARWH
jgi:hypothetical protein